MPALAGGWNPARGLILIREGIDDYRYVHTLEAFLKKAEQSRPDAPAAAAARKFRASLSADLNVDLSAYYDATWGSDGGYGAGYLHARPNNPWRAPRFDQVRREAANHILALKQGLGE
jgi:hypothetical protein